MCCTRPARCPDGRVLYLFKRAEAVAAALDDIEVDIVLSTSWVATFGREQAVGFLPPSLAARVVGITAKLAPENASSGGAPAMSRSALTSMHTESCTGSPSTTTIVAGRRSSGID